MNDDRDEDLTMMMKNLGNFWEEDDVGFSLGFSGQFLWKKVKRKLGFKDQIARE